MSPDDRDATGADDGAEGRTDNQGPVGEGTAADTTPPHPAEPAAYRPGWRERVIGWLFAFFVVVFVLWRLIPVLLAALLVRVVQTLVYLALFGRCYRAPQTKPGKGSNDAPALLLDSYADLGSGPPSHGIGSVAASVCGGLAGGAAFCVLVAAVHSVVHPPLLRGCLYLLWLLFVAFPLGATLGSVTGRAVWLRCRREEAAARTVAGRGGTGIAVGMAVAIPVAVIYAVASCGGDPDCVRWYLSLELPIFLLALVWGVALRSWSGGESGGSDP